MQLMSLKGKRVLFLRKGVAQPVVKPKTKPPTDHNQWHLATCGEGNCKERPFNAFGPAQYVDRHIARHTKETGHSNITRTGPGGDSAPHAEKAIRIVLKVRNATHR